MQSATMTTGRVGTAGTFAAGLLAAGALAGLSACGGGSEAAQLIHATLKVQSITQSGSCESTNVKVTPIDIKPGAPSLANKHEFVTGPIKMTKATDGVGCTGEMPTIPMAPGKWKFTVMLPSDISSCEREVAPGGDLVVAFKDGETGCTGSSGAVQAAAPAPADATAPSAPATPAPPKP
jgi:hypothetical protein